MNLVKVKSLLLSFILFFTVAISIDVAADPIELNLKSEMESIQAGSPFWIALDLSIEDGWHAYWKNPGDAGMTPQLVWTLPEEFELETVEWPYPSRFSVGSLESYGYSDKAVLLAKIIPPAKSTLENVEIKVDLTWVVCNDETCLPGSSEGALSLKMGKDAKATASEADYFEKARGKVPVQTESVQVKSEKGSVEGVVQTAPFPKEHIKEALFFPENRKVNVKIFSDEDKPSLIHLSFNETEEEKKEPLKGVLVVKDKSYAIDFSPSDHELIAYNELAVRIPTLKDDFKPDDAIDSFLIALVFAFFGGMILNLMPCVLPVVALKVLDFVNLAGKDRFQTLKHGLYFALGVLVSFWVLAGALLVLQSFGEAVGWGFQLQEPSFVAMLALLMVVFALSLFGTFEMGTVFASWAGQKESDKLRNVEPKKGASAAFFSGVLATAVATPCTGPLLGPAVGYALTLGPVAALTIFTFLGLGMAAPYLLLTAFPQFLKFIPKPGKWMETFRQAMGFVMLLAALWLTWVFASQTLEPASMMLLGSFLLIGIACWILGKWATPYASKKARLISWGFSALLLAATLQVISLASGMKLPTDVENKSSVVAEGDWEDFSVERLEELKKAGTPVFIDFTAKWCITCQFNHLALTQQSVSTKMKEKGIVKMKADWTNKNPEITAELKKWGRSGVPLYVLYTAEAPKILPQTLTPDIVISSLNEVREISAH